MAYTDAYGRPLIGLVDEVWTIGRIIPGQGAGAKRTEYMILDGSGNYMASPDYTKPITITTAPAAPVAAVPAPAPVKPSAPKPKPAADVLESMRPWLGRSQYRAVLQLVRSEEGDWYKAKLAELLSAITAMPTTGAQDGLGSEAIVHLHYFTGGADWFITEKDKGSKEDRPEDFQSEAFGLADIFQDGGELGYISLPEIIANGAELDFHWAPKTIAEVRRRREPAEDEPEAEAPLPTTRLGRRFLPYPATPAAEQAAFDRHEPDFKAAVARIAKLAQLTVLQVHRFWWDYCNDCINADKQPDLGEFVEHRSPILGGDEAALAEAVAGAENIIQFPTAAIPLVHMPPMTPVAADEPAPVAIPNWLQRMRDGRK